ncbi:hypothetical protein A3D00_04265, partial [Candidatus Woesebacteria bacterium RIFCSPHIGHO2_02_FULL_38_9]
MIKDPLVSIIVPAFRSEFFIKALIENIRKINYPNYEVIMVFDPSDNAPEIAKKILKGNTNWKIIVNEVRLGAPQSLNIGIKNAKGDFIAIVNCDMALDKNYLTAAVRYFAKASKNVGAVNPIIYDFHKHDRIQVYKMTLMPQTGWIVSDQYGAKSSSQFSKPVESFNGMEGIIVKREVFLQAGTFNENYEALIYDLDMNWRIWLGGFKVITVPSVKVYHWSLKEGRQTAKWEYFNGKMVSCFIQNYSLKSLIKYLPQLITIYTLRAIYLLIRGNSDAINGWIKAIFWAVKNYNQIIKKRRDIQVNVRKVTDEYLSQKIFFKGSLFDYYHYLKNAKEKIAPILL